MALTRPTSARRGRPSAIMPAAAAALALSCLGSAGCDRTATAGGDGGALPLEAAGPAAGAAIPPAAGGESAIVPDAATIPWRTATAEEGLPIRRVLVLDSHLIVERDVGVTARRDGLIETILADRGQRVTEQQPLAAMEDDDLRLSETEAALELEKEQSSFERAVKLSERGIMPAEEYESVRLRRDAAQKRLERIRYELSKCLITAPFDGVVSGRFVEKGQVIKGDDGKVLFQVTALEPLLARVYVPEWALFALRAGQPARVVPLAAGVPSGPAGGGEEEGDVVPARVKWVNDVVDAASATVEVLVEIPRGPHAAALKPGLSVQVRLDLSLSGPRRDASLVSVPREALAAGGAGEPLPGGLATLTVLEDGAPRARQVTLGFVGDDRVQIRRGLSAGETVVLR